MEDMTNIDHFNLWSFDLNLLVAFDALMRDRSVTRAAARLKMQQPAMSHNLGTLRTLFQDELFLRSGQSMQPTARAMVLAAPVREILEQAQRALVARQTFSPERENRTLSIGLSSELEVLLMPELTARVQQAAPGIKLLSKSVPPESVHRMIDDGAIDIGVGCYGPGGGRHHHEKIFEQSLLCCFNAARLPLRAPVPREAYLGAAHAVVSQRDNIQGCLHDALNDAGVGPNIVMSGTEFLTVLAAAERHPLIATLPSRIIRRYAPMFGLSISPVPLDLEVPPITMVWSAHANREPSSQWMRAQIRPVLALFEYPEAEIITAPFGVRGLHALGPLDSPEMRLRS